MKKSAASQRRIPDDIEERWELKRQSRKEAIDRLIEEASDRGDCTHRMYWTLLYDFEHAPMTTNLGQLEEAGIVLPPAKGLTEDEVQEWLWEAIDGLGDLGIFLLHTDHLDDRGLYSRLVDHILVEPVRDLPPDAGVHEFIDLVGGESQEQRELYQRHYATAEEREVWTEQHGFAIPPERPRHDRDRNLPRPSNPPASTMDAKTEAGRLPLK